MAEIRKAAKSDLPDIETCAATAYAIYVDRIGREPAPMVADFATALKKEQLYVAVENEQLVGFVVFYSQRGYMHLENVAVSPEFQQRGIGSGLIGFVEQRARSEGFCRLELYTNAKMTENLELYPRLGYRQFDRRIEHGFDRVYFCKILE